MKENVRPKDSMKYSVLMPVYNKENPHNFYQAAVSMMEQTVALDEFVLVCDGPLTEELEQEISRIEKEWPGILKPLRLPTQGGISHALAVGVKTCRNELIARMDSDDIASPDRCEKQLRLFKEQMGKNDRFALASGAIAEFQESPEHITGIRKLPCKYEEILAFARSRNPMNHMAVMMRRSAVLAVGNYHPIRGAEDYELWVRLLQAGYLAANLPDILVYARTDNGMIGRRGGLAYAKAAVMLQRRFYRSGFLSLHQYLTNCAVRVTASLMPESLRRMLYQRKLRNKMKEELF